MHTINTTFGIFFSCQSGVGRRGGRNVDVSCPRKKVQSLAYISGFGNVCDIMQVNKQRRSGFTNRANQQLGFIMRQCVWPFSYFFKLRIIIIIINRFCGRRLTVNSRDIITNSLDAKLCKVSTQHLLLKLMRIFKYFIKTKNIMGCH